MIYVSSDIETTCIDPPSPRNIIGVSFVVENSFQPSVPVKSLPHFTFLVDQGKDLTGEYEALAMNGRYLQMIADHRRGKPVPFPVYKSCAVDPLNGWEIRTINWLRRTIPNEKRYILMGKNIGIFDYQFFPANIQGLFIHRLIDVGSVHIDFSKDRPPTMQDLKTHYGMGAVAHDMYDDACDDITLCRRHPSYPKVP